jgi:hypothetical protein
MVNFGLQSRVNMGPRDELQKRIERKQEENAEYRRKIEDNDIYIQAMQDAIKLLPKEATSPPSNQVVLRQGSAIYKVRDAIRKAGKPLHITEILKALDKPLDRDSRSSISGTLGTYVRNGKIFTRPAPNTFGLIEMPQGLKGEDKDAEDNEGPQPSRHLDGTTA